MQAPSSNRYITYPRAWHEPKTSPDLMVVAVDADAGSTGTLRRASDEELMRGCELEVIQTISPDAYDIEISSQQRNLEPSTDAAVVVIGHTHTPGLQSPSVSVAPRLLTIGDGPIVLVPAASQSHDRHRERVLLAV